MRYLFCFPHGIRHTGREGECERCTDMRGCAGDVAALRTAHVRLLLRQVRQLRHIERLDKVLRRANHSHRNLIT
ncbi:unnamed protein product [Colias eurytheme]|nr:unnamed protein product [Colias eurytheme]